MLNMPTLEIDKRDVDDIKNVIDEATCFLKETKNLSKQNCMLLKELKRVKARIEATEKHGPH
jgi:hypothetical protein